MEELIERLQRIDQVINVWSKNEVKLLEAALLGLSSFITETNQYLNSTGRTFSEEDSGRLLVIPQGQGILSSVASGRTQLKQIGLVEGQAFRLTLPPSPHSIQLGSESAVQTNYPSGVTIGYDNVRADWSYSNEPMDLRSYFPTFRLLHTWPASDRRFKPCFIQPEIEWPENPFKDCIHGTIDDPCSYAWEIPTTLIPLRECIKFITSQNDGKDSALPVFQSDIAGNYKYIPRTFPFIYPLPPPEFNVTPRNDPEGPGYHDTYWSIYGWQPPAFCGGLFFISTPKPIPV